MLGEPVVEGTEARVAELVVLEPEEPQTDRGVEDLGFDPFAVELRRPGDRVVGPFGYVGPAPFESEARLRILVLRLGGHEPDQGRRIALPINDVGIAVLFAHHVGSTITELPVDAGRPDIRWLGDVRIGRDQLR